MVVLCQSFALLHMILLVSPDLVGMGGGGRFKCHVITMANYSSFKVLAFSNVLSSVMLEACSGLNS